MERKSGKKKKTTIFRIFLVPLILIMLVQSMITIGVNMTDTVMVGKLGEADPLSDFTI